MRHAAVFMLEAAAATAAAITGGIARAAATKAAWCCWATEPNAAARWRQAAAVRSTVRACGAEAATRNPNAAPRYRAATAATCGLQAQSAAAAVLTLLHQRAEAAEGTVPTHCRHAAQPVVDNGWCMSAQSKHHKLTFGRHDSSIL